MMRTLVLAGLMLVATAAWPQPIPSGQRIGLADYLRAAYAGLKSELVRAADKMPDADYDFKPTPQVRSFGQLFAHVATGQFGVCAVLKGSANPNEGRDLERELKAKTEFVKALSDSFAFCDDVFTSLTEANLLDFVKQGRGEVARSAVVFGLLAHDSEMYGISTVYLREKGIVPPSTERMQHR